ncbi:hypothetical protein HGRIS_010818 [Hohenbuehelia grisea]|uniref:Uncharacterized protein n=1 Tax=Hohenbuehelia grisea TaxID=104357 RepID=A0ABR3IY88_9AGAR
MNVVVCVLTAASMAALGVALEVALNISYKNNGFKVPQQNAVTFVSQQFLLSFIPTLFVIPVAFLWREIDWMVRWYQPYVVLSRGRAMAEESLLLDFADIALGTFFTLFRAAKYKHRIVFWSALTAASTYSFQPLAGSIFQIRQLPETTYSSVTSVRNVSLVQDVAQLNDFVAAAGFAEAAVAHNLTDPPFVMRGWATAEFNFPTISGVNGSMNVNTTGVQTNVTCRNPSTTQLNAASTPFVLTATSPEGCSSTVSFDASTVSQQYGVAPVQCDGGQTNITFQPVMFWFFHLNSTNQPEAKGVFCTPVIDVFSVAASANLNNGSLVSVNKLSGYTLANNVTGPPLNKRAYNGVLFAFASSDDSSNNNTSVDPFIRARAQTVRSGVSGAIFRLATQQAGGLQATFDLPNGFLDLTIRVYTQHLSIAAKSIYFVTASSELPSALTQYLPRLWIDPLPGHALAIMLFLVGFLGMFIHILGRRARRNLILCAPPGSIAAVMALTSRSGFGELLLPYDDEKTLEQKLGGLRYRLDSRTGAIVADDSGMGTPDGVKGRDEAMISLLGKSHEPELELPQHARDRASGISLHENSSQYALQAAAGYPPWVAKDAA